MWWIVVFVEIASCLRKKGKFISLQKIDMLPIHTSELIMKLKPRGKLFCIKSGSADTLEPDQESFSFWNREAESCKVINWMEIQLVFSNNKWITIIQSYPDHVI